MKTETEQGISKQEMQVIPKDEQALRALKVWFSLSDEQRSQVTQSGALIDSSPDDRKTVLRDYVINWKTDPYKESCPYCGRS